MSPAKKDQAHRHFIIAPVLVAAVLVSALHGIFAVRSEELPAQVTAPHAQGYVLEQPPATQFLVLAGGQLDAEREPLAVIEGSVLVSTERLAQLQAGPWLVMGLAGAIHVSRHGDDVVVAALSSPALVRDQRGAYALVPVGYQWRAASAPLPTVKAGYALWDASRQTQALPLHFLRSQLQHVASLPVPEADHLPPARQRVPRETVQTIASVLLPVARERLQAQRGEQHLGVLRAAAERGDAAALSAALNDPEIASLTATPRRQATLQTLLARVPAQSPAFARLLQHLTAHDDELWLLASAHPRFRDHAWTYAHASLPLETQTVSVFALPASDFGRQAANPLARQRWQRQTEGLLAATEDPVALTEQLVARLAADVERMHKLGYPDRASRYQAAVLEIASPLQTKLSDAAQQRLTLFAAADRTPIEPYEMIEAEEEVEDDEDAADAGTLAPMDVLPPEHVEVLAEQILNDAGALFTVETKIDAVELNTARVRGIVFSGLQRDRTFDLSLDVVRGQVRDIAEGVKEYPYPMWVEDFVSWAKQ